MKAAPHARAVSAPQGVPGGSGHLAFVGVLAAVAMIFFAANSVLCRFALADLGMDPAGYTALRLGSGAAVLWAVLRCRSQGRVCAGSWPAAFCLFAYMALFSWAYVRIPAAAGALVIAVAVQATMLAAGLLLGQRPTCAQSLGIAVAMAGLVGLLLPGLDAPSPVGAGIIFCSGTAWALYTVLGRHSKDALAATAGNFFRCLPLAVLLWFGSVVQGGGRPSVPLAGVVCAVLAGALASGLGYVLWYTVVPRLTLPAAAVVQLSVPLITALGGALWMGEAVTFRLACSGMAILGGIFCAAVLPARRTPPAV